MIINILRWVGILILLYFVFHETGVATTILIGFLALANEVVTFWMQDVRKTLNVLVEIIKASGLSKENLEKRKENENG